MSPNGYRYLPFHYSIPMLSSFHFFSTRSSSCSFCIFSNVNCDNSSLNLGKRFCICLSWSYIFAESRPVKSLTKPIWSIFMFSYFFLTAPLRVLVSKLLKSLFLQLFFCFLYSKYFRSTRKTKLIFVFIEILFVSFHRVNI